LDLPSSGIRPLTGRKTALPPLSNTRKNVYGSFWAYPGKKQFHTGAVMMDKKNLTGQIHTEALTMIEYSACRHTEEAKAHGTTL